MKYIIQYEEFFFDTKYRDDLEVSLEISNILRKIIKYETYFNVHEGNHGGWTIDDGMHFFNYKVKSFDNNNQVIEIEVTDNSVLLTTLTVKSNDLKKAITTDVKNRFRMP